MTELLEEAIAKLRQLSAAEQDEAASLLLDFLGTGEPDYQLTAEQIEKVRRTQEGLRNGTVRILSDDEVQAMWRRHGL